MLLGTTFSKTMSDSEQHGVPGWVGYLENLWSQVYLLINEEDFPRTTSRISIELCNKSSQ